MTSSSLTDGKLSLTLHPPPPPVHSTPTPPPWGVSIPDDVRRCDEGGGQGENAKRNLKDRTRPNEDVVAGLPSGWIRSLTVVKGGGGGWGQKKKKGKGRKKKRK
eukprot:Hpha_TRINITY_DN15624_c4_g7::TRINITY_DN15624_c4_g7_i1::g.99251::m.99251